MGPLGASPAYGLFKALDRNKPGTPETRAAERVNAPYRNGTKMLSGVDPNSPQVL